MCRRTTLICLAAVAVLLLPGPARAADGGRPLSTGLEGAQEAPGPGDPDATGVADLRFNQGRGTVCFELSWAAIDGTVVAAHVHAAPAGLAGPVVVPLFAGAFGGTDSAVGCVPVGGDLVKAIRKDPAAYYVNVHSSVYPAGAVRGQLG